MFKNKITKTLWTFELFPWWWVGITHMHRQGIKNLIRLLNSTQNKPMSSIQDIAPSRGCVCAWSGVMSFHELLWTVAPGYVPHSYRQPATHFAAITDSCWFRPSVLDTDWVGASRTGYWKGLFRDWTHLYTYIILWMLIILCISMWIDGKATCTLHVWLDCLRRLIFDFYNSADFFQ